MCPDRGRRTTDYGLTLDDATPGWRNFMIEGARKRELESLTKGRNATSDKRRSTRLLLMRGAIQDIL